MEEGGRLPRPLTAQLKVADEVSFKDITFACWKQLGKGSLQCAAGLGQGRWQVTFSTLAHLGKANEEGLKINNVVYRLEPLEDTSRWVTIRGAPFEMSRTVVAAALEPYGQLLHHEYEVPKETAPVTTGVRRVRIRMKKPVPNFIRVGSYSLMCTYQGVKQLRRRCLAEGHMASDCKVSFCKTCKVWGHAYLECPINREEMTEAETTPEPSRNVETRVVIPESEIVQPSSSAQREDKDQPTIWEMSLDGKADNSQSSTNYIEQFLTKTPSSLPKKKKNEQKTKAKDLETKEMAPPSLTSQELFPVLPSVEPAQWLNEFQRFQREETEEQGVCHLSETDSSFASVCASPERRDRSPVRSEQEEPVGQLVRLGKSAAAKTKRKVRGKSDRKPEDVSSSEEEDSMTK